MMESRKEQERRIRDGIVLPADVKDAMGFTNRLRSAFSWLKGLDSSIALDETTLDGIQIVKASVQSVMSSGRTAENIIRDFVLARVDAGDGLLERSTENDKTLFLGLPIHAKRFSIEQRESTKFDLAGFLASLVADGVLTQEQVDERRLAHTSTVDELAVAYKPNPKFSK